MTIYILNSTFAEDVLDAFDGAFHTLEGAQREAEGTVETFYDDEPDTQIEWKFNYLRECWEGHVNDEHIFRIRKREVFD